jgi:hypothetical protein
MSGDKSTDWEKATQKSAEGANGFIKGNKLFHASQGKNYQIKYNTSTVTKVNVIDKTAISAKAAAKAKAGGVPKGDWILRLDKPHAGAEFNHININPHISGKVDPHLKLPPGGLAAGEGMAKFCTTVNKINKVAVPLAIAVDVALTGVAVYHDIDNGTSRNTVETVASVAGGWGGGYGGATGGALIGTAICPGVGTIIGGIIGAIGGGVGGSIGASAVAGAIGDACDYDIIKKKCKRCGREFKVRKYRGEKDTRLCPDCSS